MLLDIDIDDAAWAQQLARTLAAYPTGRAILLTSSRSTATDDRAYAAGIHFLLRRPFAVHDLVEAIEPPAGAPGPTASTSPGPRVP
jgi:DNA-binding NarL/FixJ family response regulator